MGRRPLKVLHERAIRDLFLSLSVDIKLFTPAEDRELYKTRVRDKINQELRKL